MLDTLLQRADLLLQQGKYAEADKALGEALAMAPDNPLVLSPAAETKIQLDDGKTALELVESAIGLMPDEDGFHYLKARALLELDRYDDAETSLREAINLDPEDADYFALWAAIKLQRKQYKKALEYANKALALEPDNMLGLNTRSQAQLKLNDKEGAFATLKGALHEDPNNPYTHANLGWSKLESGDHKAAMEHFREALKINPNFQMARAGMAQALKARYLPYRLFLKYGFFMGKLTEKYQWFVIIGFYLFVRFLSRLARSSPELEPYLTPIIFTLAIIAFSTWVIGPISNLLLRINPYGRYLLDREEMMSSNVVGACVIIFLIGLLGFIAIGTAPWVALAAFGFFMMIPGSVVFSSRKNKLVLYVFVGGILLAGLLAVMASFSTGQLYSVFATTFVLGIFVFQWVANLFFIREDNV
ncbi:MAG: tetratricopeptide repeat protein [Bacteroidia bacterium]